MSAPPTVARQGESIESATELITEVLAELTVLDNFQKPQSFLITYRFPIWKPLFSF
jgi:predicted RNase H-like HicB family nuclease